MKNYHSKIRENIQTIKKLQKIKRVKEIMYPGQNKYQRFKMSLKKDIEISKIIKRDLDSLKN